MSPPDQQRIRWAPKVSRTKVRQLYQQEARGIADEMLLDDVGLALYARCRSIIMVTEARRVPCPRCAEEIVCPEARWRRSLPIQCAGCGWQATYGQWRDSWRHRDLYGGNAMDAFRAFVDQYLRAVTRHDRILLIDGLIHAVHRSVRRNRVFRPAAHNLLEGAIAQVREFLDRLHSEAGPVSSSIGPPNATGSDAP